MSTKKKPDKKTAASKALAVHPAIRYSLYVLVLAISFVFFTQKIVFINADLGRHIKNGEVIVNTGKIIPANYYSYTEPDFPVVYHHWGSGVVFYLIQKIMGFAGLSIIYCLLSALAVFLLYKTAENKSHPYVAFLFFILCIPLIAMRTEIRPEVFSLLFMAIYIYLFELFVSSKIHIRTLLITLPLLQLLWVNLHIFFVFGLIIAGVYIAYIWWLRKNKETNKLLLLLSGLLIGVCFINPYGLQGVLTPLTIFNNYAYMVAENQSVFFMQNRFGNGVYIHYEVVTLLTVLLMLWYLKKSGFKPGTVWFVLVLLLLFVASGYKAIRLIPFAGAMLLAFAPGIFMPLTANSGAGFKKSLTILSLIAAIVLTMVYFAKKDTYLSLKKSGRGFGIYKGINNSADFFKANHFKGPVFNNYDIGGYLIYHLFPENRVFIDNRPEAYSTDFFEKVYNPMLEKETVWQQFDKKYQFNCIYFFRLDETPFGQPFIIKRINDRGTWAPVYVDDAAIILLKRNARNQSLIQQYELPPETFVVTEN
ncbi:MAG TPA: hypothetical protein PLB59_12770 [Bacteroidales bacterium]|nr:hypothetical protein [Bacteroidales bacterium]